jgi:hypothetical protein
MPTTTRREVSTVKPDRLLELFLGMTEAEISIIWRFGGFEGTPPQDRDRLVVAMVRGMSKDGRRSVGRAFVRAFASLRPEVRAALVAFLLALVIRPAGVALPAPAPRALTSQRRCHRLTPARAP